MTAMMPGTCEACVWGEAHHNHAEDCPVRLAVIAWITRPGDPDAYRALCQTRGTSALRAQIEKPGTCEACTFGPRYEHNCGMTVVGVTQGKFCAAEFTCRIAS